MQPDEDPRHTVSTTCRCYHERKGMIMAERVQIITTPGHECPSCHNGKVQHGFSSLYSCSLEVSQQLYAVQSLYRYKELYNVQSKSLHCGPNQGSQYNVTNLYMVTKV